MYVIISYFLYLSEKSPYSSLKDGTGWAFWICSCVMHFIVLKSFTWLFSEASPKVSNPIEQLQTYSADKASSSITTCSLHIPTSFIFPEYMENLCSMTMFSVSLCYRFVFAILEYLHMAIIGVREVLQWWFSPINYVSPPNSVNVLWPLAWWSRTWNGCCETHLGCLFY